MQNRDRVGKPTGRKTRAGRPIITLEKDIKDNKGKVIIPKGSDVSEISLTIKMDKGNFINIPSVHNNKLYSEAKLKKAVKENRLIPTSHHKTEKAAIEAAKKRSRNLK
jgi:ribosomal protein L39E